MIKIRPLTIEDIEQAIQLSHAERWNQTEKDWELLVKNSENVCLGAVLNGKLIGTSTAINYNKSVAWIGMVLVNKEFRGRGVSKLLLASLFKQLKHIRSLKLDATPAGQPVYQKFGFKDECVLHRMTADSVSADAYLNNTKKFPEAISMKDISEVIEFDKQVFGADRRQLIEFLISNNRKNSWMIRREGKITGVVLGRKGSRFFQIGPVLAANENDAKILIKKVISGLKRQPFVVDVPEEKKEFTKWLIGLGFQAQRPFIRMYQNENLFPGIPEQQFLICGPEFG